MPKINNLSVGPNGHTISVGWDDGKNRFHVWLDTVDNEPVRPFAVATNRNHKGVLYKNPLETDYRGRRTLYLDPFNKTNKATVQFALAEAERLGLFEAAVKEKADKIAAEEEERLNRRSGAARKALEAEREVLRGEGRAYAADAISAYLSAADRSSLVRLYEIVTQPFGQG